MRDGFNFKRAIIQDDMLTFAEGHVTQHPIASERKIDFAVDPLAKVHIDALEGVS